MKLNQSQIQDIENYLDYKKLEQVDLRYEVLDHMAEAIETAMENGVSYVEALAKEKEKWNPELESYSSGWLGIVYVGPKIMIKKCIGFVKKMYLETIVITGIIYIITPFIPYNFNEESFYKFYVIALFIPLLIALCLSYKIRISSVKTTYQYYFKTQDVGYLIALVFFGLIIGFDSSFFSKDVDFFGVYVTVTLYSYVFYLLKLYRKHNNVMKQMIV